MGAMTYREVMDRTAAAAGRVGRKPEDVVVVAVSKDRSLEEIIAVYDQGHRDFGENRARELADKAAVLPGDIRWHFVGALQTNKARIVRPVTSLLHSMDRESLALAWIKGRDLPPPVLVQVNVGGEVQKSGVSPEETMATVETVLGLGLEVRGLMTVPPVATTPEASRPYFRMLADLGGRVAARWPGAFELSMGMTDDFEVAVEEGASIIRVGRAIFGSTNDTGAR